LESTNRALVEENKQLRTELQLMRDHLLNPDSSRPNFEKQENEKEKDEIRIQMGVVQGVRDQLENSLKSLRAIGGDMDMKGGSQVRISCSVLL
jgi:regulator of replication initiation timing